MSAFSSDDEQEASSNPLTYIPPTLLAELNHLDLTGKVSINNRRVVASGTFGDISKSRHTLDDGTVITVAVKCLRFHTKEEINLVSSAIRICFKI